MANGVSAETLPLGRHMIDPSTGAREFFRTRGKALRRAAMIGNFPPRMCGIATFTRDLVDGISLAQPDLAWTIIAMNDRAENYEFGPRVNAVVRQHEVDDYVQAAELINCSGADAAFLQHEFGIFGGPAGEHVLELTARLRVPLVVTLHTVLATPDEAQRRVMQGLIRHATTLVVMAERGANMLREVYDAPLAKIRVIPHGAPSRGLQSTLPFKERLGLAQRQTVLTFGLLSPNKGIETIVRALPAIVASCPEAVYVVAGATHPHLVQREGEAYRDSLVALASELGVSDRLVFIDRFLGDDELIDILAAADVYVTPYLTEAQITSGTLSYALALGRPTVSTPYWHAQEALADGVGILCPFGDEQAFGAAISALLTNERKRSALSRGAYLAARPSRWENVGAAYISAAGAFSTLQAAREAHTA